MTSSMLYGTCIYMIVSIWSLGLLLNDSKLFPWIEITRCLLFLGYQIYRPVAVDSLMASIALYAVRLFYFYSAWQCRVLCAQQIAVNPAELEKTKSN